LFAVLLLAALPLLPAHDHGKEVTPASTPPAETAVTLFDPHVSANVGFQTLPAAPYLDSIYGPAWRKAEMVMMTCTDGYQAMVPVEKLIAHPAFFAFAHSDGSPFQMDNLSQNEKNIPLGPWYLVWEDSPAIRADGGADWPYQVVALDLIDFATRFPKLAPPATASAAAKRGFVAFRQHCLTCHTLNGEGGAKAVELNYPANVTEYYRPSWIRKWIDNPASVRFNTVMPALDSGIPNRAAMIEDLVAYLASMKEQKIAPAK
jgi:mono/diheme cytochrome c family protein